MSPKLATRYMGLDLKNPLVAAASPVTAHVDALRALEDAGIGAVTLPSLFEEQLEHEEMELVTMHHLGTGAYFEASEGYFPELDDYNAGPDEYLDKIRVAKQSLEIPVIASLNGTSAGGWVHYANLIQQAGADALELNIYHVPTDPEASGAQVEEEQVTLVREVRQAVRIPLAVKILPFYSAPLHMARRLSQAGADGLVLFSRFMQPEIDLERQEVLPNLRLSSSDELRLGLRWIALMEGKVNCSLAASTGVHTAEDALKLIVAGADAVTTASALLRHGPPWVSRTLRGMEAWLEAHDHPSLDAIQGALSQRNSPDPDNFERISYLAALASFRRSTRE
ncbi:MAG: dihydroorotate dehydrogenase-like protein [Myxococcales bacterium]|nr:dihydroorotate dehydrogenase-like protein [Myxococcales bacterium]MCB9650182.1 dihydroorotate dehydrogenase-like protein [Deltaproteobacteria bacterium]